MGNSRRGNIGRKERVRTESNAVKGNPTKLFESKLFDGCCCSPLLLLFTLLLFVFCFLFCFSCVLVVGWCFSVCMFSSACVLCSLLSLCFQTKVSVVIIESLYLRWSGLMLHIGIEKNTDWELYTTTDIYIYDCDKQWTSANNSTAT